MKRVLFLLTIALLAATLSFAQTKKETGTGQSSAEEQALKQIEQELTSALVRGDATPFERHLAGTLTSIGPDGKVQDKAALIALLRSDDFKIESSQTDQIKIRIYGNAAVVTYRSTDIGAYKGEDISGQTRWTDVFVRQADRWQIVSMQGTRVEVN